MKIAHVTSGLSFQGAGVRAVVEALARAQSADGHNVGIFGLEDNGWGAVEKNAWSGLDVRPFAVVGPKAFGYAPSMASALIEFAPDVVHLHGLWMHPVRSVLQWHRRSRRPYILSVHGMLSSVALGYSPIKKRIARSLFQDQAFAAAACLHATTLTERNEVLNFGLKRPIVVVPNGVAPISVPEDVRSEKGGKTVLTLGRIHRKKGIDVLLEAWAQLDGKYSEWSLRVVGPDENGHTAELKALAARLGLERFSISGAIYGTDRDAEMACADIFVLPTRSENFALTVAESLMLEVPVISSKGAPWPGLEEHNCGFWVDLDPTSLANALSALMTKTEEDRREMGRRGRAWMLRDFNWQVIGGQFVDIYAEAIASESARNMLVPEGQKNG